jgi:tetratricopeptide (TPR) repeat protein
MSRKKPAKKTSADKKTKKDRSESPSIESPPSLQSLESLLAGFSRAGRGKRSAVDEAQDLMYDAWEAPTREQAVALARQALTVSADCADAYNFLAEETAETLEEAIDIYRKGVEAGERALGKKAFKEAVGHFWSLLETRPYMRSRAGLAQCLWEAGQRGEAVEHYWELLRLNPNDNQGVRQILMPCLIELGRDEDAEKLFKQYETDDIAIWRYSRALLDFRKHGDSSAADKSLKAAIEQNKHVPSRLLGRKKMPRTIPDYYSLGSESEAVIYVYDNIAVWKATPGALEWLAAKVK